MQIIGLTALIIAAAALAGSIAVWWNLRSLNKLRDSFFASTQSGNLEQVINSLVQSLHGLQGQQQTLEQDLQRLKNSFNFAFQKLGVVRFNPFSDGGGNFSFCIALLDAQDNGLVITSMYGREQNRIYTKKITLGKCESTLTEEEQKAIVSANGK